MTNLDTSDAVLAQDGDPALIQCIFCLQKRPPSLEHVFPYAIGGCLTINSVCTDCNSWLGAHVDTRLSDHPTVRLLRSQHALSGHKGNIPDGFRDLLSKGVLANDPTRSITAIIDPITEKLRLKLGYKAEETLMPDGSINRQISFDASGGPPEIAKILKRERARAKLSPLTPDELDQEIMKTLQARKTIQNPSVLIEHKIDISEYRVAILKIVYELAWMWLGDTFIGKPDAEAIRQVIFGKMELEAAKIRGTIQFADPIPALAFFWGDDSTSHIASLVQQNNVTTIVVRVFNLFSAMIVIDETDGEPTTYFDPAKSPFIAINPVTRTLRQSSLALETHRICELRNAEATQQMTGSTNG